ncbi:MAG: helix-turn-helix transcriptional regulator [Candidatus Igneacidithiobacillus chanchocoensis]
MGRGESGADAEIGKRIRNRRRELGYSSRELAQKIGLHRSQYLKIEAGYGTTIPRLRQIAQVLKVPLSYLVGDTDVLPSPDIEVTLRQMGIVKQEDIDEITSIVNFLVNQRAKKQ